MILNVTYTTLLPVFCLAGEGSAYVCATRPAEAGVVGCMRLVIVRFPILGSSPEVLWNRE